MSTKREPLVSDERIATNAHGDWAEILAGDEDTDIDWADGFRIGHRKGQRVARSIYEAARAKDAELIQRLLDALHIATRYEHCKTYPERWHASIGEWDRAIDAAKAAGFTPSE